MTDSSNYKKNWRGLYFTALVMGIVMLSCSTQNEKTEENVDQPSIKILEMPGYYLYGEVKSLRTISFRAKDSLGVVVKGDRYSIGLPDDSYTIYDRDGKLLEMAKCNLNNELDYKLIYNYSDKGNLSERLWVGDDGDIKNRYTYIYDELDNEIYFKEDNFLIGYVKEISSEYNRDNLVRERNIKENGKFTRHITFQYDQQNKITNETVIEPNGGFYRNSKFLYDKKGNLTEIVRDYNDYKYRSIYEYDNQDREILSVLYKEVEESRRTITRYTENGLEDEVIEYFEETISERDKYFYDKNHKLKEKISTSYRGPDDQDITQLRFIFTMDSRGNWVKRVRFKNSVPETIVLRDIEYFTTE